MSAQINFNPDKTEMLISAHLNLYGKYANIELGQKIVDEINSMWNAAGARKAIQNIVYTVVFEVTFECLSNEEVLQKIMNNTDFKNIFIRIEDKNITERSMMGFGLGENSGHWLITDQLGESTTAAHEFGHALGLPHPDELDYRNSGFPPIMAPRGTLVDAPYQWDPNATPGEYGGTMKPIYRKVRAAEVIEIISGLNLSELATINIGKISNQLFDEIGRPAQILNNMA